jgi:hypothetical protein
MINLNQLDFLNRRKPSGLLGLALDGSRLDGVVLQRVNGSLQLRQAFSITLSLDPLTNDPALVGREIRNHLDAAGVRERRCVAGLPLKWALAVQVKLPELPEADIASFLAIEAERGFPCDVTTLYTATSQGRVAGERHATVVGVPRNNVTALEQALRAAQLRPVSFSPGITALQNPAADNSNGVLALVIGEGHIGLQITAGGGVAVLRTLEGAIVAEGGQRKLATELVSRETRITLGQLPPALRAAVKRIRIFGPRDLAQELADEMELRFEPAGLQVELAARYDKNEFGVELPADAPVSAAFSLAAGLLVERPVPLEFLPPKVSPLQQLVTRYSSGKLRTIGATAGAALLLGLAIFLFQQCQLWWFGARWNKMSAQVTELQSTQDQIRQFRPWFDESVRDLSILRALTLAFPEDGTVTAKTIEIRDPNLVTCSGTASDIQTLLKTLERLRGQPGVADASLGQIRGKSPMQYTFNFHWSQGGNP